MNPTQTLNDYLCIWLIFTAYTMRINTFHDTSFVLYPWETSETLMFYSITTFSANFYLEEISDGGNVHSLDLHPSS